MILHKGTAAATVLSPALLVAAPGCDSSGSSPIAAADTAGDMAGADATGQEDGAIEEDTAV